MGGEYILASYWSEFLQEGMLCRHTAQGEVLLCALESLELLTGGTCSANLHVPCCYNIVSCACFLFLLVFSVYQCSYAPAFFLRETKKQLLIFVEGLNAERCSLLTLFNFGRVLKMTYVYAAFLEQTPCCVGTVALGRVHVNVLLWA